MFVPGVYSESEALLGYLQRQLESIRAAAHGLTEFQAREQPCRSALSIGGLVKHATFVLRERARTAVSGPPAEAAFLGSFTLAADETLASALGEFDAACAVYLDDVRATDPAAPMIAPPAPWDGIDGLTASVQRFELMHHVEELARHAGHADIIREQLDGAAAASLLMAVQGRAGNEFVQPWTARAG